MVDIPNDASNKDVAVVGDAARVAGDFRALGSDVSVLAGDLGLEEKVTLLINWAKRISGDAAFDKVS